MTFQNLLAGTVFWEGRRRPVKETDIVSPGVPQPQIGMGLLLVPNTCGAWPQKKRAIFSTKRVARPRPRRRGQGLPQTPWRKINSGTTTTTSWSQSEDCFQSLWRLGDGFLKTLAVPSALTFAMTSLEWERIALVKEVAGTLLRNTDHRGPGHLRALFNGVGHSSSEAMDEEPSVPFFWGGA